jgi:hypothetical protein
MRAAAAAALAACAAVSYVGCVGTTGGEIVTFPAAAAGPEDASSGQPLEFTTDRGWHVVLTRATLHVGALYLDQSMPVSGSQGTSCILPGTYVAQVTSGRDVDLLSPQPQPFPAEGQGTTVPPALVGQVWLTGGDIDAASDTTPILVVAGTADQSGTAIPFTGKITMGSNRQASGTELAGASPICKQRIVSPIPTSIAVSARGGLLLRIDPRFLFVNVDFSQLTKVANAYEFSDDPSSAEYTQPSRNLYLNLHSSGVPHQHAALYAFSWSDTL